MTQKQPDYEFLQYVLTIILAVIFLILVFVTVTRAEDTIDTKNAATGTTEENRSIWGYILPAWDIKTKDVMMMSSVCLSVANWGLAQDTYTKWKNDKDMMDEAGLVSDWTGNRYPFPAWIGEDPSLGKINTWYLSFIGLDLVMRLVNEEYPKVISDKLLMVYYGIRMSFEIGSFGVKLGVSSNW